MKQISKARLAEIRGNHNVSVPYTMDTTINNWMFEAFWDRAELLQAHEDMRRQLDRTVESLEKGKT